MRGTWYFSMWFCCVSSLLHFGAGACILLLRVFVVALRVKGAGTWVLFVPGVPGEEAFEWID